MKESLEKNGFINQTAQPSSFSALIGAKKDLTINKPETNAEERMMLALCDSLDGLYDKLSMLSNAMEMKIMEQNLSQKK
jgi:hypothetical protein